jgi:hypothetical protein
MLFPEWDSLGVRCDDCPYERDKVNEGITMKHTLTENDLGHFHGSDTVYKHSLVKNVKYTEGVRYVASNGGAYWLIDKIATLQLDPKVKDEEFQAWTLKVNNDKSASLVCDDGNNNEIHRERIDWTDFPLDHIKFYFCNDVIMLPSEY